MRQLTLVGLWALLLVTCVGCSDSEPAVADSGTVTRDAGADAAAPRFDAGRAPATTVDASVDIHFLVIALLLEMERSLLARCPCLTAAGEYESASECVSAVSLGRSWIDCANRVDLSTFDNDETHVSLRCNVAELSLRSECLMGSSCAADAIAGCMTQTLGCTTLPYEVISKVVSECTVALSR